MNIYLITEDGETFCIKAKTMQEAVKVCLESHVESSSEVILDPLDDTTLEFETKFYHDEILESCQLIGELKN